MKIEKLSENLYVYVSKNHTFGTDSFLLTHFSISNKNKQICDLGSGCGIIPMLLYSKQPNIEKIFGVEIQQEAYNQFTKSVEKSNLAEKIFPIHGDIKSTPNILENGKFDLITCNPPYKSHNSGVVNPNISKQIANHETLCTIQDIVATSSKLLNYRGRLCLCQRPERLVDVLSSMRLYNIEPKRVVFIHNNPTSSPWLFLVEGCKGGRPFLKIDSPLYMDFEKQKSPSERYISLIKK